MGDYLWLFYAGLSAVAAALVSIFGKIGLQGLDANTATTVRSVVMALFLIGVMIIQRNFSHLGEVLSNRRALLYIILSGTAGALSWLFYFVALKYGRFSQVAPSTSSVSFWLRCLRLSFWAKAFRLWVCPEYY